MAGVSKTLYMVLTCKRFVSKAGCIELKSFVATSTICFSPW